MIKEKKRKKGLHRNKEINFLQSLNEISLISNAASQMAISYVKCFQNLSHLMTKPTKWRVRPAKTQICLGIHPVWSESSLSAWRKLGSLATHWAHSEDSYRTGLMPGGCQGWSESSLRAQSFCWFCHVVALFKTYFPRRKYNWSQNQATAKQIRERGNANPIQLAKVIGDSIPLSPDLLAYNLNETMTVKFALKKQQQTNNKTKNKQKTNKQIYNPL